MREKENKIDIIWTYKFEDGTELHLVNTGFSGRELDKMVQLHGKIIFGAKKAQVLYQ